MKKPSQSLTEQEQAKLTHLKNQESQLKKSIENQRQQANSDVEELKKVALEGINLELSEGKKELKQLDDEIASKKSVLSDLEHTHVEAILAQEVTLSEGAEKIAVQQETLTAVQSKIIELESTGTVLNRSIEALRRDKLNIDKSIDDAIARKIAVETALETFSEALEVKEAEVTAINEKYDADTKRLEDDIEVLEVKKYNLSQEIVNERENQQRIVENLANRQRELDERDTNLRIREEKLRNRERVMVRNSNLLNL